MQADEAIGATPRLSRRGGRPLVTFFVAGRDVEAYVEQALHSLLTQTLDDFELLFLDDGSQDKTLDIVMGLRDPRLRVLKNETSQGIARSLNRLMEQAAGEFWAHMDADDVCLPERLERQVALLREDKNICVCGCCYSPFNDVDVGNGVILPLADADIRAAMLFFSPIPHPFATFRGDFFKAHALRYAEKMTSALDYELWLRIAVKHPAARFANVGEVLGAYRKHERQISAIRQQEQRHMATRAQMQVFRALGFAPADQIIRAHGHLYHYNPVSSAEEMQSLFQWVAALKAANDRTGLFQLNYFNIHLLRRMIAVVDSNLQFMDKTQHQTLGEWMRAWELNQ